MARQSKSDHEDLFAFHVHARRLPTPVRELVFSGIRRWRFDFAWPASKLAVEIEGGIYTGGRHVRPSGFVGDLEKYNTAVLEGWRVLRFSPAMVKDGTAINMVVRMLTT